MTAGPPGAAHLVTGPLPASAASLTPAATADSVWVNGERYAADGMHVSARDRGFTLADGLFETMRVRHGRVFRLDDHLTRLDRGLQVLQIPPVSQVRDWVLRAVASAPGIDAGLRLTVTRGVGRGGVAPTPGAPPTAVVAIGAMPAFPASLYEAGLSAHVASGRRNERSITSGLKTLAYVDAVAALLEAQRAGADEAIFLDTEAHCSEATASNLFVWTGRTLLTPPVSCGALPGITRAAVLELAAGLGLDVAERSFALDQLLAAQEVFLTSSLRGLAPLVRIGDRPIGAGTPGSVTTRIRAAYDALVERECGS
ncbi:MAG TPA: aminotransferase class IV [Vicinamibacterales bacterium]|nr:aminotransferase class IV [Vicinamibacterales bacterium]